MKWISVKDRMPKEEEIFLAFGKTVLHQYGIKGNIDSKASVFPCTYDSSKHKGKKSNFKPILEHCCGPAEGYEVTHWMPLPNTPEEAK